ncbi:hypothetical protein L249_8248 [Ophiocordyceps polyrhachis-furcata BCC 54312]|uniref:Cyclin N-terminal domain-containing protein n=1 Tax=Ophiocordyceps polyrhachis-furcata BCC 54312 TaxID=1330021 RepID=A0A367LHB9_9HYPO|nr:hypothetical protein L249_8248 [Ophiocordyceps polyrhachis-furcata BCC 54312]
MTFGANNANADSRRYARVTPAFLSSSSSSASSSAPSSTSSSDCSSATSFASASLSVHVVSQKLLPEDVCLGSDSDSFDARHQKLSQKSVVSSPPHPIILLPPPREPVPSELRLNPRRTASSSSSSHHGLVPPPALVRHSDRRISFVDSLVGLCAAIDASTHIVEAIWPLSVRCRSEPGSKSVLSLRIFIQETLRRSRTSYSTLQVALYYLILIKARIPKCAAEQHADPKSTHRALQCGRRMFLAALILASKYLQDRNYSARAWSKISGLNTHEINQNEMAFLVAVNWKLHIADDVFKRWTDIVLKCMPPPPPPPPTEDMGTAFAAFGRFQAGKWQRFILRLDPSLANAESLVRSAKSGLPEERTSDLSILSPRSILNMPLSPQNLPSPESSVPAPSYPVAPVSPDPSLPTCRPAPTLGPLPTPRLTPNTGGLCTPAASAPPWLVGGKGGAMGLAMAQAGYVGANQGLGRFPWSFTSSPQGYHHPSRRSSLANSVSTASSPESMVSDSSSRSSTSSLGNATHYISVPWRFRGSRMVERACGRPSVPTVVEDRDECRLTSSPEAYPVPYPVMVKGLYLDTPLARREFECHVRAKADAMAEAVSDAARALQDLHNQGRFISVTEDPTRPNQLKRDRPASLGEVPLQDNVREMMARYPRLPGTPWLESMVQSRPDVGPRFPVRSASGGPGKRVCCSAEAASAHPALGTMRGPGIWNDILN